MLNNTTFEYFITILIFSERSMNAHEIIFVAYKTVHGCNVMPNRVYYLFPSNCGTQIDANLFQNEGGKMLFLSLRHLCILAFLF